MKPPAVLKDSVARREQVLERGRFRRHAPAFKHHFALGKDGPNNYSRRFYRILPTQLVILKSVPPPSQEPAASGPTVEPARGEAGTAQ